jgi:hypothetical protein
MDRCAKGAPCDRRGGCLDGSDDRGFGKVEAHRHPFVNGADFVDECRTDVRDCAEVAYFRSEGAYLGTTECFEGGLDERGAVGPYDFHERAAFILSPRSCPRGVDAGLYILNGVAKVQPGTAFGLPRHGGYRRVVASVVLLSGDPSVDCLKFLADELEDIFPGGAGCIHLSLAGTEGRYAPARMWAVSKEVRALDGGGSDV